MHATCKPGNVILIDPTRSHADLFAFVLDRIGELPPDEEVCVHNCLHWFVHDTITRCKSSESYYVKLEVPAMVFVNKDDECFVILVSNDDEEYPRQMPLGLTYMDDPD